MTETTRRTKHDIVEKELNADVITSVERTLQHKLPDLLTSDLSRIILFGSCARGDYDDDSDIDVALIMNCSREEAKRYEDALADLSTNIAMNNYAIVNFCCIPRWEFDNKKDWYLFFHNIATEGIPIYG